MDIAAAGRSSDETPSQSVFAVIIRPSYRQQGVDASIVVRVLSNTLNVPVFHWARTNGVTALGVERVTDSIANPAIKLKKTPDVGHPNRALRTVHRICGK